MKLNVSSSLSAKRTHSRFIIAESVCTPAAAQPQINKKRAENQQKSLISNPFSALIFDYVSTSTGR
jgi:hypothetical protein